MHDSEVNSYTVITISTTHNSEVYKYTVIVVVELIGQHIPIEAHLITLIMKRSIVLMALGRILD